MNDKITIQDIIELLTEKHGIDRKDAETFVKGVFGLIEEALTSEKYVKIKGLGAFKLTEVDSRGSVNVNTGERIQIQGHTKVSFTPDAIMKDLINKPFAHFETVILNENTQLEDTETEIEGENTEEIILEKEEIASMPEVPDEADTQSVVETFEPKESIAANETTQAADIAEEKAKEEQQQIEEHLPEEATTILETTAKEDKGKENVSEANAIPEPIVPEPELAVTAASDMPAKEEEKRSLWRIIAAIILLLCIAGGIYWFIQSSSDKQPVKEPISQSVTIIEKKPNDSIATQYQQTDTVSINELQAEEPIKQQSNEASAQVQKEKSQSRSSIKPAVNQEVAKVTLADTVEYDIVGTKTNHALQEGESIIKLALKFYGSKKLWPYIVKYNKNIIKDADRVPIGTILRIPDLAPKKQ